MARSIAAALVLGVLLNPWTGPRAETGVAPPNPNNGNSRDLPLNDDGARCVVEITLTWQSRPSEFLMADGSCVRECNGSVHSKHTDCDFKCDKACTIDHSGTRAPDIWLYDGPGSSYWSALAAGGKKMGVPDPSAQVIQAVQKALDDALARQKPLVISKAHFNDNNCSSQKRQRIRQVWHLDCAWTLVRYDEGADGHKARVVGPSGKFSSIGNLEIWTDQTRLLSPDIRCRCKPYYDESLKLTDPAPKNDDGVRDEHGYYVPPEKLEEYHFAMNGDGLNAIALTCSNPGDQPLVLNLNPGTWCTPDNNNCQSMLGVGSCQLSLPAHTTSTIRFDTLASTDLILADATAPGSSLPSACVEFAKKVPSRSDKFTPDLCSDPHLQQLSHYIASEKFRGPWDQGAVWIVTDHLTREEMNKKLIPGLSPWIYLKSLRMAGQEARIDFQEPAWRNCLDPALLLDEKDGDQEVAWLVKTLDQHDPSRLASWVDSQRAVLAALRSDPALHNLAILANGLCQSQTDAVRLSGINLLKVIPLEARATLTGQNQLYAMFSLLESPRPEIVLGGIELATTYARKDMIGPIAQLASKAADPNIQSKAREALASLKSGTP